MAATAAQAKPRLYVVDMPARTLKKMPGGLSKNARRLYGTMRALANGRTGELSIRGNPLDWKYICRQAEVGRYTWLRALRELRAAGYVTVIRERIPNYTGGRKRTVLGRALYVVHRQPKAFNQKKTAKTRLFSLKSDFCTVQQSDSQRSQKHPETDVSGWDAFDFQVSGSEEERAQSSSASEKNRKTNDDMRLAEILSKANPFLTDEDADIIRSVRKNLAECWSYLYAALKLETVSDNWFAVAMDFIESRGHGKISSPVSYFTTAFVNFLSNIASGVAVEGDQTLLECINEQAQRKAELREKYMKLQPLTPQQEEQRRAFNGKMVRNKD